MRMTKSHFITLWKAERPASRYAAIASLLWGIGALLITLGLQLAGGL